MFRTLLLLLILATGLQAQALRAPPGYAKYYTLTATGTAQTQALTYSLSGSPGVISTRSILVCNDSTTDSIAIDLTGGTATASPTNGGTSIVLLAGEKINLDGEWSTVSYIRLASTSVAVRIIATYGK